MKEFQEERGVGQARGKVEFMVEGRINSNSKSKVEGRTRINSARSKSKVELIPIRPLAEPGQYLKNHLIAHFYEQV